MLQFSWLHEGASFQASISEQRPHNSILSCMRIYILNNEKNHTSPWVTAIIFFFIVRESIESGDRIFVIKQSRWFFIFLLKSSSLDSRVLIARFFKYRIRYFDFGNLASGKRSFFHELYPILGESLFLLAILICAPSILPINFLKNLNWRFLQKITNYKLFFFFM